MPNDFLTTDFLEDAARDAAILLRSNMVAANLINRDVEERFVSDKTGGSVRVKVRPTLQAHIDEQNRGKTSLTTDDNKQEYVSVDATNYIYQRQELTTGEQTFDLDDFTRDVSAPAVLAIQEELDSWMIGRIAGGFARNVSGGGTLGTAPSTIAHIADGMKTLNDNRVPQRRRVGLVGSQTHASLVQEDKVINADYGDERPRALREGAVGRLYGFDIFMDQNAGTFDQGDTNGTVVTNGAVTAGDEVVSVDGLGTAEGVIREGTRFTIAGDSQTYVVTEDVFYSGSSADLPIYPAAQAASTDGSAVTFETAFTEDVFYHRDMVAGAIVAPQPMRGTMSAVGTYDNISIRLSIDGGFSGSNGASDEVLFDVYVGGKVVRPEGGTIVQG